MEKSHFPKSGPSTPVLQTGPVNEKSERAKIVTIDASFPRLNYRANGRFSRAGSVNGKITLPKIVTIEHHRLKLFSRPLTVGIDVV
jgi:hypothetical protein